MPSVPRVVVGPTLVYIIAEAILAAASSITVDTAVSDIPVVDLGLFFSKMKSIDLAKLANLVGRPISLFTEERYRSKMADLARAHAGIQ